MKVKRTINNVLLVLGVVAIGLCTAVAIKTPDAITGLIGVNNEVKSVIQGVPYYVNFGDLGTSDTSYKTQYFKYGHRSWYLAWGNHGQQKDTTESDGTVKSSFNMLLGWNSTKHPVYGGYSYVKEVMKEIDVKDGYNYSYVVMDFDFNLNHLCEFSFSAFENLSSSETTLHLITSHDKGSSWSVADSMDSTNLTKDNMVKFSKVEDSLTIRTTRYGMVLVSNSTSARIELDQFIVSRLSQN